MNDMVTRAATPAELAAARARAEAAAAKAAIEPPQFVEGLVRTITVPIDYPVTYDGKVYSEVTIRRPTNREWKKYLRDCADAVQANGPGADDLVDQPWVSAPAAVLEELDFADAARIEGAQDNFFGLSVSAQPGTETEVGETQGDS